MTAADIELKGKKLILETGEMAKQSDGSVVVKYGDTVVLATAVASGGESNFDFFPLTVDYQEKAYAAGKIPGGFFKREGKPSEKEVLTSRLIDRPIRPLFPDGFNSETQGIVSVLSYGSENVSDTLGIIGMSAALVISDIPFEGPVSAVRIGRIGEEYVINPNISEMDQLDLNLVVAGTDSYVLMVEGEAFEVSEEVLINAIEQAHAEIKKINSVQKALMQKAGRQKRLYTQPQISEELKKKVEDYVLRSMKEAVKIPDKIRRQDALDLILKEAIEHLNANKDENDLTKDISNIFYELERNLVRKMILEERIRADGRKPDEIRHISAKVGLLPRAHGSALFVRGETQALAATTLGTADDEQKIDSLDGETYKTFMLHYNFPPFSVGEVKPLRSPGRREIGHGALAERALKMVVPPKEKFPYTIRVVSDILESNGSSSMATVCGATLSLMDAGVPIKAPVAGIAMGLVQDGKKNVILTDILGLEDHLGDMDFKVTGTESGITAFQLDVKTGGLDANLMKEALEQARKGRLYILGKMKEIIESPRTAIAPHAPRIYTI